MIAAAPFADRVVHHALCNHMQPQLERSFIAHSFSCQVGKGTTAARQHVRRLVNRHRFVLKCDVRRFFDSINHEVLLAKLRRLIVCPKAYELVRRIVASHVSAQGCGLPIGNLTSQLWGNFLLDGLDHRLVEEERCGSYARYTDDFLVFADDKPRLWGLREVIVGELAALRLELAAPKSRVMACREGVPYCGWRFFPGRRPRVLGEAKRRFLKRRRALLRLGETKRATATTFAWYQYSREGNSEGLRRSWSAGRWCGVSVLPWPRPTAL